MLLQRVIAALILIPIVLVLILKTSYFIFSLFTFMILALAAEEWAKLFKFKKIYKYPYILLLVALTYFLSPSTMIPMTEESYNMIFIVAVATWLFLSFLVVIYNHRANLIIFDYIKNNIILQAALGLLLIVPFGLAILLLKSHQNEYLLLIILIMGWVIDSGAYFVGKFFGKHKLIKNVSPGKTLEGVAGGLLSLGILNIFIYYYFYQNFNNHDILNWCLYTFIIFYFAVFGDLTESMIKRIVDVKDSGNLIPGHGGILDRLDSIISILPVYYLILKRIM